MTDSLWSIRGRIDAARLATSASLPAPMIESDALGRVVGDGIGLSWRTDRVSHAIGGDVLVLLLGRCRSGSRQRIDATQWLELYRTHGESTASHVGGAFAALIVDRARQCVLVQIDRFAAQTLCYAKQGSELLLSDRALDVPLADKSVDPQAIYDYLYFHVIPAPSTVYREVRRVDAGHTLKAGAGELSLKRWWVPDFEEHDNSNLEGRLRQFLDLADESVREEIDEPGTACFLSGGTDSSTVAGMLSRARGGPVDCYSIGFEAEGYDEMEYARIAARHFKLRHHEYYITPKDLVAAIPTVATAYDQPFGNSSVLPTYYCALRARGDGHTRMLAGDGGDELFGGNTRYAAQQLFELYGYLPRALRESVLEPMAKGWPLFRKVPGLRQMGGYVRHSSVPMPDRMESFNLLHRFAPESLFQPGFRARFDPRHAIAQQRATYEESAGHSLVNRMLAYDWKYTLADSDLPKVRGATALAGVSVGFPLLSRQLTDFSLTLPPNWKVRRGVLRWFFKKALSSFLPQEIIRKKKHGFGLPFGPWTLRTPALHDMARDALHGAARRGILNAPMADQLMKERLPEAPGYYGEIIWILMMLEYWLAAHAPRFECRD